MLININNIVYHIAFVDKKFIITVDPSCIYEDGSLDTTFITNTDFTMDPRFIYQLQHVMLNDIKYLRMANITDGSNTSHTSVSFRDRMIIVNTNPNDFISYVVNCAFFTNDIDLHRFFGMNETNVKGLPEEVKLFNILKACNSKKMNHDVVNLYVEQLFGVVINDDIDSVYYSHLLTGSYVDDEMEIMSLFTLQDIDILKRFIKVIKIKDYTNHLKSRPRGIIRLPYSTALKRRTKSGDSLIAFEFMQGNAQYVTSLHVDINTIIEKGKNAMYGFVNGLYSINDLDKGKKNNKPPLKLSYIKLVVVLENSAKKNKKKSKHETVIEMKSYFNPIDQLRSCIVKDYLRRIGKKISHIDRWEVVDS
jgi:hypothetical protein